MSIHNLSIFNTKKIYFTLGADGENATSFCLENGLIKNMRFCLSRNDKMNTVKDKKSQTGFRWRCGSPCFKEISPLKDSFFEGSNHPLDKIIIFIFNWAYEECTFKKIKRDLEFVEHTYVDWKSFLREVCALKTFQNNSKLGGPGIEVQIDESLFVRRKYNRGRIPQEQWVYGAIDCRTKESILVPVERRDANTLIPIILKYIMPGSIIVSDAWPAYLNISNYGYNHFVVNYSENFVDPLIGMYTQRVENMWMGAKRRNKKECGTRKELLEGYLFEFMWREKYNNDPFKNIIDHIRLFYS